LYAEQPIIATDIIARFSTGRGFGLPFCAGGIPSAADALSSSHGNATPYFPFRFSSGKRTAEHGKFCLTCFGAAGNLASRYLFQLLEHASAIEGSLPIALGNDFFATVSIMLHGQSMPQPVGLFAKHDVLVHQDARDIMSRVPLRP
jgi:hypothetical protein